MRAYGKQEFGQYPLITMEPRPERLTDYYKLALYGEAGVRAKNRSKHLVCARTAKTYLYWDNLVYHFKHLAPLYGKRVDFKEYTCPHDGWLFSFSENLRLHNKVVKLEQAAATEIEKRLNLDNPDWKHPSERNEERYILPELDELVDPKTAVKKSRFLKKERPWTENTRPARPLEDDAAASAVHRETVVEKSAVGHRAAALPDTTASDDARPKNEWPHDPDDLEPLLVPKPKANPEYLGWTHSEDADSWYLEAHTPSMHEHYEGFYSEALRKRVICPKLYSLAC